MSFSIGKEGGVWKDSSLTLWTALLNRGTRDSMDIEFGVFLFYEKEFLQP